LTEVNVEWTRSILGLVACLALVAPCGCGGDDDDSAGSDDDAVGDDDTTGEPPFHPPDEPGPYPAGTEEYEAPSREGLTLPVQVWFPAVEATDEVHTYDDLLPGGGWDDAEPDCSSPYPVLLFSHGNSGIRYQTFSVMEFLASHGWVVVAPDHVQNTFLDFDTDLWPRIAMRRPWDIADTFDWLVAEAADADSDLYGCIDPEAGYAVMGHSFGGWTTYAVAGASLDMDTLVASCAVDPVEGCDAVDAWVADHPGESISDRSDPRAWAAVPWAPAWHEYFGGAIADIEVPTAVLGADRDTLTEWDDTVLPSYLDLTVVPRYLAGLQDAGHYSFTDFCDLLPASSNNGCEEDFRPAAEVLDTTRTLSLAFLLSVAGVEEAAAWMPPEEGIGLWEAVEE